MNLTLEELINRIPSPNRECCFRILKDNSDLFHDAWGSSHNHQAYPGGYLDHVTEVMRIATVLYSSLVMSGRLFPFTLEKDALLVLFLHDIEKPWKKLHPNWGKAERRDFRKAKIAEYGFRLSVEQENALRYVEGEGDDYRSDRRVMNELAAFCHMCDVASARIWHS